jgi:hypothetical protein
MTRNATLSYPFSSVFIRGEIAFPGKNKNKKISKRSEPNIGKLPGSPSDLNLNRKCVFAVGTQEVIENNTGRSLGYPKNPRNQRYSRLSRQPDPLCRTFSFSPQSAEWSALCLIQ